MEKTDESEFEYEAFHEPANPRARKPKVMDDKKYTKCRKAADWTCMQKE